MAHVRELACEQLIRNLETKQFQAIIDGDFDQFAALAHPDLAYVHSTTSSQHV